MNCPRCLKQIPDDAVLCCYCARYIVRRPLSRAHQRGNGTGTAWKRGRTWTAVVTKGWKRDENGVNHQIRATKGGFKTKNEALAYCDTLKHGAVRKNAPNLAHYWQLYERNELLKLSSSKQTAYTIAWKKLKAIQLRAVDTLTVQDLRDVVVTQAPTYYPARDMKVLLGHLFDLAGADRWVDKELPEYIILPELVEKQKQPFTEAEQTALWKLYDSGDRRAAIPLIMIYTGMMPGEMQGLKLDMIDIDNQRITGASIKTKVRRASPIYLPDIIIPVLIDEMQHSVSKKGYVWPRNEDKFYENYYGALACAGCRRLEPYSCRHTTATALAIGENIAPQTVRKIMRWSTTKMLDRYAHPDDADALAALNKLPSASAPPQSAPAAEQPVSTAPQSAPTTEPPASAAPQSAPATELSAVTVPVIAAPI